MATYENIPKKRRPLWLLGSLSLGALLLIAGFYALHTELDLYRLEGCSKHPQANHCLAIAQQLQRKHQITPKIALKLADIFKTQINALPAAAAVDSAKKLTELFPELPQLKVLLTATQLRHLEDLSQVDPERMLNLSQELSKNYLDDPATQFTLGELQLKAQPPALKAAVSYFTRAIKQDKAYAQKTVVMTALQEALKELPRSQAPESYALAESYFLEPLLPFLEESLNVRDAHVLRNNAFQILKSAGRISEEQEFTHHWLNLLSGNAEIAEDYNDAQEYFKQLPSLPTGNPMLVDPKNLDFSYFPNLEKIPDYYLHATLELLLQIFPQNTKELLHKNLNDTKNDWRRVNSFYTLKPLEELSRDQIHRYHTANLALPQYSFFTDWLGDSIDYFAQRGGSGKEKLQEFVQRIVALKQQSAGRKETDKVAAYAQIESYIRPKIGKRN